MVVWEFSKKTEMTLFCLAQNRFHKFSSRKKYTLLKQCCHCQMCVPRKDLFYNGYIVIVQQGLCVYVFFYKFRKIKKSKTTLQQIGTYIPILMATPKHRIPNKQKDAKEQQAVRAQLN